MKPASKARPRFDRRKQIISGVLTLAVIIVVFLGVFPRVADYGDAWEAVQQISITAIAALVIATLVNIIVYVWPFQAALPGLSYGKAFVVRHTSFMVSNAVPAGGAVGLGLQYSMLSGYGVPAAQAAAAVGITSTWNILVTLGMPAIAVVVAVFTGIAAPSEIVIAVGGVIVIMGAAGLLAVAFRSDRFTRGIGDLAARPVHVLLRMLGRDRSLAFADTLSAFRASTVEVIRRRWLSVTLTNLLMQLSQYAILFVALAGIQSGASDQAMLAEAFVAFGFARLATFIPITPGGLGTVDAALVAILVSFGTSNPDAVAAVLLWRALSYFPQVILGVVTFLHWRRGQPAGVVISAASDPL